jgi:hypothetical protein
VALPEVLSSVSQLPPLLFAAKFNVPPPVLETVTCCCTAVPPWTVTTVTCGGEKLICGEATATMVIDTGTTTEEGIALGAAMVICPE